MNLESMKQLAYDLRPKARTPAVKHAMGLIEELKNSDPVEYQHWKPRLAKVLQGGDPINAGGLYYQDTKPPFLLGDVAAVTLTAAMKQMWSTADFTPTFQTDWFDGKLFMLRCFGRITTAATPGNLTVQMGYGVADAAGAIATSAALTLIASQTSMSWRFEGRFRCRSKGVAAATGKMLGTGIFECNVAVIAAGGGMVPATVPAEVTTLNFAQTSGLHLQLARSGSTVETAQVHDLELVALN